MIRSTVTQKDGPRQEAEDRWEHEHAWPDCANCGAVQPETTIWIGRDAVLWLETADLPEERQHRGARGPLTAGLVCLSCYDLVPADLQMKE